VRAIQITDIRARLAARTPGSWLATLDNDGWCVNAVLDEGTPKERMDTLARLCSGESTSDACFIASAADDIEVLLDEVERLTAERDRAVDDCGILVREVHALGAGAVLKSRFQDRQPVAPAGSTPSPAPISDYRKSYAIMFRRAEREKLEALAKVERLRDALAVVAAPLSPTVEDLWAGVLLARRVLNEDAQ
jgi:hypothetical protein